MAGLTKKQQLFSQEYLVDMNATRAYFRAGYSVKSDAAAGVEGHKLLKNPKIQEEIKRLMDERSEKTGITAERVVQQLAKIAFMDVKAAVNWTTKEIHEKVGRDPITHEEIYTKIPITQISLKPMEEVDGTLVQSIKMGKHGIAVEFPDRMKAMEMLAKHLGVYDDRPQQTVSIDGYKKALWERANAGDVWDGFNNGGPDPGGDENDGQD